MSYLDYLVEKIDEAQLQYGNEADLQLQLADLLRGHPMLREHKLTDGKSRIDFFAPRERANPSVGIEVKVKGSLTAVVRQLTRYAACPEIDSLILVTTQAKHHRIPTDIDGKPVRLISLIGGGL